MTEALYVAGTLIVDVFLILTGEWIRWMVSLGAHEPRWALCTGQRPADFALRSEPSAYIGAAFWAAVIGAAFALLP